MRLKSFCVRTQIAKTGYLPAEYIPHTFLTRYPLPLFRRLTRRAAIEKNFFIFFVTPFLFGFILDFIQNIYRFNSLQVSIFFSFDFVIFFSIIILGSVFFDSIFRLVFTRYIFLVFASTCFGIIDSTL